MSDSDLSSIIECHPKDRRKVQFQVDTPYTNFKKRVTGK